MDHLFIFEGNGVIRDYPGNYTQYRILEKSKQSIAGLSSDITTPKEFKVPEKEVVAPKPLAPEVKKSNEKMTFKENQGVLIRVITPIIMNSKEIRFVIKPKIPNLRI